MKNYYGVNPSEKRKTLIKSKAAKPILDEIFLCADKAITEPQQALKMSEYMMYHINGNRSVFQEGYFNRRRNCTNLFFAYWLSEDEKYLEPLIDYISYICDEFTWCLPAHSNFPTVSSKDAVELVDLFQAETVRLFAEIVMCVGDKLPQYIIERMRYETDRRIFATFDETDKVYWWEECELNWATVCGAGCMMAALCFTEGERRERYFNRFMKCLDAYLKGIGDDGCCKEGMNYWNYGFGNFLVLAQAVKEYSDGRIDYFKNPKVRAIALFPQNIRLTEAKVVSFSDSNEDFRLRVGVMSFLKNLYGNVLLPEIEYTTIKQNIDSVCELLWFDEDYTADTITYESNYLGDAQWLISRNERFSFAAKGGDNEEPHNHNDIGAFMITVGDKTLISDLGAGEYVKETFLLETRYGFLHNSSRGHSVPIINGEYQQFGKEFCARNTHSDGTYLELDIEGAYPKGIIDKINRRLDVSDDGVRLTDTFTFSPATESVEERFISKVEPKVLEGYLDFGIARLSYDSDKFSVKVSEDTFASHNDEDSDTIYIIDFSGVSKENNVFKAELEIYG